MCAGRVMRHNRPLRLVCSPRKPGNLRVLSTHLDSAAAQAAP